MVLWDVRPCAVADIWDESVASPFYPENGGTRLHGVISQKTAILILIAV
jgi:hypothetical protein